MSPRHSSLQLEFRAASLQTSDGEHLRCFGYQTLG